MSGRDLVNCERGGPDALKRQPRRATMMSPSLSRCDSPGPWTCCWTPNP